MLKLEIIQFEAQDIVTASCVCKPGLGQVCAQHDHYGCPFESQDNHLCELGES